MPDLHICPFCRSQKQRLTPIEAFIVVDCETCGQYRVTEDAWEDILMDNAGKPRPHGIQNLANCAAMTIRTKEIEGKIAGWTTGKKVDHADGLRILSLPDHLSGVVDHASKSQNLLLRLATKASQSSAFSSFEINRRDMFSVKIPDDVELETILNHLHKLDLIAVIPDSSGKHIVRITPHGWENISSLNRGINSTEVFIAMQFSWKSSKEMEDVKSSIKAACKSCGFDAHTVNDPEHIEKISDKIIAGINRAKFVIADFTNNNRGVYYEAGYAKGLGIPVIHTVKEGFTNDHKDPAKKIHFDIRDINYIEWNSPVDLEEKLKNRIEAVIQNSKTTR